MGLELEDEVCDIDEEKHDSSSTGDDEETRFPALLDGTASLAVLQESVYYVILHGLRHEVGGRDDERFYGASKPSKGSGDIR